jgi:hypothetical protein
MTLKLQHCWKHNVIIVKASWKVNSSSVLHEASAKLHNSFEADSSLLVMFCSNLSVEHSPYVRPLRTGTLCIPRVFEISLMRCVFGSEREEVIGQWRQFI